MKKFSQLLLLIITTSLVANNTQAQDQNFHIYLCFGQSNMEGQGTVEAQDRVTNPRVKVLQDQTCSNLNRVYGQWYTAAPPLNRCFGKLGPADYFGKTMAAGTSSAITIGIVNASVSGCDIALYQKSAPIGRAGADIPTQFNGGYAWLLDLARKAKTVGVIKGIIFHQGETNTNDPNWKFKVQQVVNDLRTDLGIGNVPFLAGELLYREFGSCCSSHNTEVNKLPGIIPNAFVISASGLAGADVAHFTSASYRELGRRYAQKMLTLVGTTPPPPPPPPTGAAITNGTYKITARHSGKSLNVQNSSTADGGNVIQWTYGGGNNEKWFVQDLGGSTFSIKNVNSNRSLDVVSASTADGADINQWFYSGGNNQKWRIESVATGFFRIVSVNSGKCVDVTGASTADGAAILQWGCSGANNQSFTFEKLSSVIARAPITTNTQEGVTLANVYPNPATDRFNIYEPGAFSYTITNALGKVVEKGKGVDRTSFGTKLSKGLYVVHVAGGAATRSVKLVKQ